MNLINFFFNSYKQVDKIGFYINEEYIFDHYTNLFKQLDPDLFEIILSNKFKKKKYEDFKNKLKLNSWNFVFLDDVYLKKKYIILVSHLYVSGNTIHHTSFIEKIIFILHKILEKFNILLFKNSTNQYFQKKLGKYNVRYMYGADVGGVNHGEYNNLFNEFFCHGPKDANFIRRKFKGKIFEMGYPRYDDYEIILKKKNNIKIKYQCDLKKSTIVWVTTKSIYFSTIKIFYNEIVKLKEYYNIIIRPHPLEMNPQYDRFDQEVYDILSSSELIICKDVFQNMTELYAIADLMICDYGGTLFSSVYLNKKILLLNNNNYKLDLKIHKSTSEEVRQYLPSIDEDEKFKLKELIEKIISSPNYFLNYKNLREIYFGNSRIGECSKLTAKRLVELKNLL